MEDERREDACVLPSGWQVGASKTYSERAVLVVSHIEASEDKIILGFQGDVSRLLKTKKGTERECPEVGPGEGGGRL